MPKPTTDEDLLRSSSLSDLQRYVRLTGEERGFSDETAQDSFMLLVEEIGEVAKSMRPMHGVKVADDSLMNEVSSELADVQLLLMSLSNALGVDLWQAVVEKERRNRSRKWN